MLDALIRPFTELEVKHVVDEMKSNSAPGPNGFGSSSSKLFGFIKGRNILVEVVILHEVIHELKTSKKKGLIMKIDFEKAYDNVRWNFLEEVMVGKGLPVAWIGWIMQTVQGGKSV